MDLLVYIIVFVAGAAVGSFLNVVIDRVPEHKSIVNPPSHCDSCNRRLGVKDLIPVFSYIFLKGKCSTCGSRIPLRVLLVEIGTGLLFILLLWRFGPGLELLAMALYACIFIVMAMIDIKHGILPNSIIYPMMPVALVIFITIGQNITGLNSNFFHWDLGFPYIAFFLNSLLGGATGFVFFLIIVLISRGAMGMGDVKLAALIGLMTGFPLVAVSLFISILSGGLIAIFLLLTRLRTRKDPVPFGPFLCLGALISLIWGRDIMLWYIQHMVG
jgi:leader peptidase (prepilin peptidase)/N-methyltransferase